MNKIESKFREIRNFCKENANGDNVKKYSRYFTEGYDAYGLNKETYITQRDRWLAEWEKDFSLQDYLELGNKLISTGKYEEASFAISFMYCNADKFTAGTFEKLGFWLENHIFLLRKRQERFASGFLPVSFNSRIMIKWH